VQPRKLVGVGLVLGQKDIAAALLQGILAPIKAGSVVAAAVVSVVRGGVLACRSPSRHLRRDPFRPLALGPSSLPIVPGWTGIDR
jgi:hypothetical protein